MSAPRSLGQRLSAIIGEVAPIEATGQNRFSKAALSVEDVEDALRPLFAKHGVIALWDCTGYEMVPERESTWLLKFHVTLMRDDENPPGPATMILPKDAEFTALPPMPSDRIEADWFDIGSSPSAAQSFAVKGFYRRLFHLASADDEHKETPGTPRARQTEPPAVVPPDIALLAERLPTPWAPVFLAQELRRLEAETVRRRLRQAHENACGANCMHLIAALELVQ